MNSKHRTKQKEQKNKTKSKQKKPYTSLEKNNKLHIGGGLPEGSMVKERSDTQTRVNEAKKKSIRPILIEEIKTMLNDNDDGEKDYVEINNFFEKYYIYDKLTDVIMKNKMKTFFSDKINKTIKDAAKAQPLSPPPPPPPPPPLSPSTHLRRSTASGPCATIIHPPLAAMVAALWRRTSPLSLAAGSSSTRGSRRTLCSTGRASGSTFEMRKARLGCRVKAAPPAQVHR